MNTRIFNILKNRGISQYKLAKDLGISLGNIASWKSGKSKPAADILIKLAQYFGVTTDYLLGISDTPTATDYSSLPDIVEFDDIYPIPLLGEISAGKPVFSPEHFEGVIYTHYKPKEDFFALRVHGDSMIDAGITDGSVIIARKQETADSGQIVVALLNGDETTVKRYKKIEHQHLLIPENKNYDPIFITKENNARIIGVVVEVRIKV